MNPARLAAVLCLFTAAFLILSVSIDAYLPYHLMLKKSFMSTYLISTYGSDRIAFETTIFLSLFLNSVFIWLFAKPAYAFMTFYPTEKKSQLKIKQN